MNLLDRLRLIGQQQLPAPKPPRALLSDQLAVPGLPAATDLEMIRILRLEMWLPPTDAEQLPGRARGVGERAYAVEHCRHAKLLS